jgi:ketosteroid isomerase-like protein
MARPRLVTLMANTEIVRAAFDAYRAQDRDAIERLLADDYTFTSPQDDHIDRAAYLDRCFPTADRFVFQQILELVDAGDNDAGNNDAGDNDGVFLLYEYELTTGERYRNAEFSTMRDGQLVETQVFFGGVA